MDRRLLLLLAAAACVLAGCASSPTPISVETSASEAISAARHVAYWMDVDLANVRHPDESLQSEMARLKAGGARLSAQAEALEQELEAATVARMEKKGTTFTERGPLQTRLLREQTIQVRTQWEAFLKELAARDALDRPGAATGSDGQSPAASPSGTGDPPRPGRGEL